jgi:hypothetical protein
VKQAFEVSFAVRPLSVGVLECPPGFPVSGNFHLVRLGRSLEAHKNRDFGCSCLPPYPPSPKGCTPPPHDPADRRNPKQE